jgi:hypothetical protein
MARPTRTSPIAPRSIGRLCRLLADQGQCPDRRRRLDQPVPAGDHGRGHDHGDLWRPRPLGLLVGHLDRDDGQPRHDGGRSAAGTKAAFKMARTSGQTGVVQMCMLQEVESVNVYQLQGQIAELDFEAITGANFSPASGNMTAYIITGTGTDQGVAGSASVAFGLNAGGGGSGGWTGQANATAAVIALGGVSTGRYAAVGTIPAAATEIAVAICMTPVGTAGTNDYVAFQNIQLVRNPARPRPRPGYSCDNQSNTLMQCTAFDRSRNAGRGAAAAALFLQYPKARRSPRGPCAAIDTTHTNCWCSSRCRCGSPRCSPATATLPPASPRRPARPRRRSGNCTTLAATVPARSPAPNGLSPAPRPRSRRPGSRRSSIRQQRLGPDQGLRRAVMPWQSGAAFARRHNKKLSGAAATKAKDQAEAMIKRGVPRAPPSLPRTPGQPPDAPQGALRPSKEPLTWLTTRKSRR